MKILSLNKGMTSVIVLILLLCSPWTSFYHRNAYATADSNGEMDAIKKLVQEHPDDAEAFEKLGSLLLRKGELDDAISAFNTSLKINPRMHAAKTGKGFALLKKGNMREAETTLKDALKLNPNPSITYYGLGLLYEEMKDYEKAVINYKEGIKKYKGSR